MQARLAVELDKMPLGIFYYYYLDISNYVAKRV